MTDRYRYIVLVWLHDHWGVTYESNDLDAAEGCRAQATKKVPTVLLDMDEFEFGREKVRFPNE